MSKLRLRKINSFVKKLYILPFFSFPYEHMQDITLSEIDYECDFIIAEQIYKTLDSILGFFSNLTLF